MLPYIISWGRVGWAARDRLLAGKRPGGISSDSRALAGALRA